MKQIISLLLMLLFAHSVKAFYIEPTKEPILGIPPDILNHYVEDPFFKARYPIISDLNFIHYQAWEDGKYIFIPSQGYFDDDPHCCPTDMILKIRKKDLLLISVEVIRYENRDYTRK